MNPMKVAANRTARLASEAATPVFSTSTPPREHRMAVEVENDYGHRSWDHMKESEVSDYISGIPDSYSLSDVDHSAKCWCAK